MFSHLSSKVRSSQEMTAITVSPTDSLISTGETRSFTASAVYSDGSTADITASVQWSVSGNATLGINGSITAGSVAGPVTVTASYNGYTGVATLYIEPTTSIFVSTASGNDSTVSGSSNKPFKTLNYAYLYATLNSKSKIFVAAGDYNITTQLIISQNIAIYGGYSAADWSRNIQTNKTRINEASGSTGAASFPASPILLSAGSPELNGLYINGSSSAIYSAAVHISGGSPSIIACALDGGSATNVYGFEVDNASATIDSCIIKVGTSGSPGKAYGLYCTNSGTLKFYNSVLTVQGGSSKAVAIYLNADTGPCINQYVYNCALIMEAASASMTGLDLHGDIRGYTCNNTIVAHNTSTISDGLSFIDFPNIDQLSISNNIVDVSGTGDSSCIKSNTNMSTLSNVSFNNNLFYKQVSTYYFSFNSTVYTNAYPNLNQMLSVINSSSTDNICCENPAFFSTSDFHPASNSPVITKAKLNGSSWPNFPKSSSGPIDLDGVSRPTSGAWTIGAYQNAKNP